jgi:hypothetical protein
VSECSINAHDPIKQRSSTVTLGLKTLHLKAAGYGFFQVSRVRSLSTSSFLAKPLFEQPINHILSTNYCTFKFHKFHKERTLAGFFRRPLSPEADSWLQVFQSNAFLFQIVFPLSPLLAPKCCFFISHCFSLCYSLRILTISPRIIPRCFLT